jgi:hypothetical protein
MKKRTRTFATMAGATSLVLSLPLITQMASAATNTAAKMTQPVPTQVCVQALAERDTAFLSTIDGHIAAQKTATTAHRNALLQAAKITNEAERQEALKKAQEDFQTAMKAAFGTQDHAAEMAAMKTACGDSFRGGMRKGFGTIDGMGKGGKKHGAMMKSMHRGEKVRQ